MTFGRCRACDCMKEEISFLRSIIKPPAVKHERLPIVTLEADAVLGGAEEQVERYDFSPEEKQRYEAIESERANLLSGQY